MHGAEELAVVEAARRVLPAGGFGNVSYDLVLARGKGSRVWDLSGNEYIDYLLGSGPMIVGHSHPEVLEAVQEQVAEGMTFFANNAAGIRLAEVIVEAVACAEKVRFVSTGSEADLYAMRVARAFRKRDKILKFEGGYHGMSDFSLMSLAPKRTANFPQPIPDSAGVPRSIADDILIAPFNDIEVVQGLVREHKDELAAIIVEPCQRLIPPKPGFLEGLRKIADDTGVILIFDEVVTGFRYAYGGAQALYGVTPDLCTLGKAIGGGFPLAAIAGRADIMAHFDKNAVSEENFVLQIGTLSGNPVAAVAGLKPLEILKRPGSYDKMFAVGRALMDGYRRMLSDVGIQAQVTGEPPMFDIVFSGRAVTDYRSALGKPAMNKRLHGLMLERGVLKSENKHYISLAHDERDVSETLAAFEDAIEIMRKELDR
jgi:glutamate-1-semialdehyde 2,1-aminomutase